MAICDIVVQLEELKDAVESLSSDEFKYSLDVIIRDLEKTRDKLIDQL